MFSMPGHMVRVVDGDTAVVHPSTYRPEINVYIRFKDRFAAELNDPDPDQRAIAQAEKKSAEDYFPVGCQVELTNDRIHWSYERLEARVDRVG
jgi:hypothetical protein